jgi:hypothetical protein
MTVCSNRTDDPGFFTSCFTANGFKPCLCGEQVAEELKAQEDAARRMANGRRAEELAALRGDVQ